MMSGMDIESAILWGTQAYNAAHDDYEMSLAALVTLGWGWDAEAGMWNYTWDRYVSRLPASTATLGVLGEQVMSARVQLDILAVMYSTAGSGTSRPSQTGAMGVVSAGGSAPCTRRRPGRATTAGRRATSSTRSAMPCVRRT